MHCSSLLSVALLSLALPLFTSAEHHGPSARRHNALANRKRTQFDLVEHHKRDNNARATFYDVGLGACGITNVPSDYIVALNSGQFGGGYPGPHCFKMITIQYQGQEVDAQITDECPGCPYGGLDLSIGLFTRFAAQSVGVIYVNWWYKDGGAPAPSSSQKPKPTSTYVPPATTSSSKWVDPSPWTSQTSSSSKSKESSTWSSSSSSIWSSSSATWNSTGSAATHAKTSTGQASAPYATPTSAIGGTASAPQNLQGLSSLVAELGGLVVQYGS